MSNSFKAKWILAFLLIPASFLLRNHFPQLLSMSTTTPIEHVKLGTWNLRYDSKPDLIPVSRSLEMLPDPLEQPKFMRLRGEQPWSLRRVRVSQQIIGEGLVVIGFQEALVRQVQDLAELLGDDWGWVGVGRDDGKEKGEFSPIFYKKSVLKLVSWDTFWLSDTPFTPSRYPDAGSRRLCTTAHFTLLLPPKSQPSISGKESDTGLAPPHVNFTLLNTHLDDRSDEQRQLGASMLLARARYEAVHRGGAVFVTGDFNSESTGRTSAAYHTITGTLPSLPLPPDFEAKFSVPADKLPDFTMYDARAQTSPTAVRGGFASYTGFKDGADVGVWARIDFVFGGRNKADLQPEWTVQSYNTIPGLEDDGLLLSDHRLLSVDLNIHG